MQQFVFCFTFFLLPPLRADESKVDGSRGLKRGVHVQGNRVSYGNFAVDKFHRLQVSIGSSIVVSNYRECALNCVNNPPCSSFNVASSPRSDGKYRCELLNEDKYSANPGKLVSSQEYHHYSIKTPCLSFPCQNGAKCVPNYAANQYHCDCVPGYTGKHCETGSVSCSDIKSKAQQSLSRTYMIDPDGEGGVTPFSVYCDMSDKGGVGVAVISHDSESRTHVGPSLCGGAGCYSKDVRYTGVSTAQLAALTRVSQNCEQFIKFECNNDVLFIEHSYAWWVSRDGTRMNYWGGATGHDKACACGVTKSCSNSNYKCNCHGTNNKSGWHEDSGLLTDKSSLPVTQIRLGDLGDSHEDGYHTLGKLKCYGQA